MSNKILELCCACLNSKSKATSQFQAKSPLELIYTNVWGPSPICSKNGSKYYVSFLDAFSEYTWLYLISCKGDVTNTTKKT
jgi:hypothetical protein